MTKPTLVFDTEVYKDYFLVSFKNADTGNVRHFEMYAGHPLDTQTVRSILRKYRLVSFNGINFDMPILATALTGGSCADIKAVANKIILNNMRHWQLGIDLPECDHIDLIEVAPGIASLKIYGGRLHAQRMQDLPIEPEASISPKDRDALRLYCGNDLDTTLQLFRSLEKQIDLRAQMSEQYGIDLRSKSDAQIAEAVINHEVSRAMGNPVAKPQDLAGKTFGYRPPRTIAFTTAPLAQVLATVTGAVFTIGNNGVVQMPKEVADLEIAIGHSVYRMGIGGLHSSEKCAAHLADDDHVLIDRDVASYYPAIILNCGLKPKQMGDHFTTVYRSIVERRLAAKKSGDKVTADALKITINGSFGKFGSPYSRLYSPTLLIQTTVTGQLSLLMLIEALECDGIPVVSANTDGIVIKCPRSKIDAMENIVAAWEMVTGFDTEATHYQALYSRDVNNYVAIKSDGYKLKGVYAPPGLQKNPTNQIVAGAVVKFLQDGTPIERSIHACTDVRKFVTVRTVKGGALDQAGAYLGKAVRWYYSTEVQGALTYKINGYKVPRSEGARPLMELPDAMPHDLDRAWYINEARQALLDIGYKG